MRKQLLTRICLGVLSAACLSAALPAQADEGANAQLSLARAGLRQALRMGQQGADLACMSLALYHEARGEPLEGQVAVAATILNRVASRAYPDSICGVVFENAKAFNACQFTFACDGRSDMPGNPVVFARMVRLSARILSVARTPAAQSRTDAERQKIRRILRRFILATHYHRHDVYPSWSRRMGRIARVGNHVFFRSLRVLRLIPDTTRHDNVRVLISAGERLAGLQL